MTTISLDERRANKAPAAQLEGLPSTTAKVSEILTTLARSWDRIVEELSTGPGQLSEDDALVVMWRIVSRYAHVDVKPGELALMFRSVIDAVRLLDLVRDHDTCPADVGMSYAEALGEADAALDNALWPLLRGRPLREACRSCRHQAAAVDYWQTQVGCSAHDKRAL